MLPSKITFTDWIQLSQRFFLTRWMQLPGVYALAHFPTEVPSGKSDTFIREIIYYGESQNPLRIRLRNFINSANTGNHAHSAGRCYHDIFLEIKDFLYIAVCDSPEVHISEADDMRHDLKAYLIDGYISRYGTEPRLHRKLLKLR